MTKIQHHLVTGDETLFSVVQGAEKLYKAVSATMGPRGRNVIFRKDGKKVGVTHDGVTVARAIQLDNPMEDVAADLIKEAAGRLDATTGDGTTTVTVLTYHILRKAYDVIRDGENPMKLKLDLDREANYVVESIIGATNAEPGEKEIVSVATVASGSLDIGKEVGEAVYAAGTDTPVLLGFSDSTDTYTEVIDGFKIDAGSASPYLMDTGPKREYERPYIVVIDADIRDKEDILPLLKLISQIDSSERNVLFICRDVAGDALSLITVNHLKQFAGFSVARVPDTIGAKSEYLHDIALIVGGHALSRNTGYTLADPSFEDFGRADKVVIDQLSTLIVGGQHIEEDMVAHRLQVEDTLQSAKTAAVRDFAEQRLLALNQKILSIHVGGQSQTDAEERHYRYEDAVGAARAALRGGVVPGGGTLLYGIANDAPGDTIAQDILYDALKEPLLQLYANSGIEEIPDGIGVGFGYDVLNPEQGIIELEENGILDPAESEIEAVKTAVAIAGLLMTAGALIVDERISDETSPEIGFSPNGQAQG